MTFIRVLIAAILVGTMLNWGLKKWLNSNTEQIGTEKGELMIFLSHFNFPSSGWPFMKMKNSGEKLYCYRVVKKSSNLPLYHAISKQE